MANTMNFNLELQEISLEGYQVVSSKFFGKQAGATMSLQKRCIVFNSEVVKQLNNCEAIHVMINEENKTILAKPISSHDPEAVIWNKGGDKQYARLECTTLTKYLMDIWKLSERIKYIANGRLVRADNKVGMIFDFKDCQRFDAASGKRI